jgi:hypothetical protein
VQTGDMIGTVMAWLGEVEGGGATAFLHQVLIASNFHWRMLQKARRFSFK